MKNRLMMAMMIMTAALSGCGDPGAHVGVTPTTAQTAQGLRIEMAARPAGPVGGTAIEILTPATPDGPLGGPVVWVDLRRVDGGPVTAQLSGRCIALRPDGTATVTVNEPAIGGVYQITASTAVPGIEPEVTVLNADGQPGEVYTGAITVALAGPGTTTTAQ